MRGPAFISLILLSFLSFSQSLERSQFSERVFFGGGMGLNLGSNFTTISASPLVGYKITDRLSAGVGVIYQYSNYRDLDLTLNHYGGSLFTRYIVFRNFFATVEYEYLTIEFPVNQGLTETDRQGYSSLFAGGGIVQPITRNVAFTIIGLYNLLYDPENDDSPYGNPLIFRAGINVGF